MGREGQGNDANYKKKEKNMDCNVACVLLKKIGYEVMITMKKDSPVEILFWDEGLSDWNSYCVINDDETIPQDAIDDILFLV